jgi:hypothetical protein
MVESWNPEQVYRIIIQTARKTRSDKDTMHYLLEEFCIEWDGYFAFARPSKLLAKKIRAANPEEKLRFDQHPALEIKKASELFGPGSYPAGALSFLGSKKNYPPA